MIHTDVDIVPYRPEFKPEVMDLMQYLWDSDTDRNRSYFEWKYETNPYTELPLGFVAIQKNHIVGFRGYFVVPFKIAGRSGSILVLCPGDTCVHPDYRRQALSVQMGNRAMRDYAGKYRIFLNTSCTRSSLPGYLKMGFHPLVNKHYTTQSTFFGLVKYILSRRQVSPLGASRIRFGSYGNILISQTSRPEEMSALIEGEEQTGERIRLVQDAPFFRWRFGNPRSKYVFYYILTNGIATGYVVLCVSPNNRRGYIVDYAPTEGQAIQEILRYIVRSKQFEILSIYTFCLDDRLWNVLKKFSFKENSLVRVLERKLSGELPILIRPVRESFSEKDCFIEGLDIRKMENWSFKPIVSDAV